MIFEKIVPYRMVNTGGAWQLPFWSVISRLIPRSQYGAFTDHSSHRIVNTVLHSVVSTVFLLLWVSALQLCGPFRTLLCMGPSYEHITAGIVSSVLICE